MSLDKLEAAAAPKMALLVMRAYELNVAQRHQQKLLAAVGHLGDCVGGVLLLKEPDDCLNDDLDDCCGDDGDDGALMMAPVT